MSLRCARGAAVVAVLISAALGVGEVAPAVAAPAGGRRNRTVSLSRSPAFLSIPGTLAGVTARSSSNAWAVGSTDPLALRGRPLLAHWNGMAWRTVSSPALPSRGALFGVAKFRGGAWAVGRAGVLGRGSKGSSGRHLIVRLTGSRVRRVPVPAPVDGTLWGVAATSGKNAWAVGSVVGGRAIDRPLILHWNGTAWRRARLASHLPKGIVRGVAATSRTNAWAVLDPPAGRARFVHWNGRRWSRVASPDIGKRYQLLGVAATSARNAWAVGFTAGRARTVILHWNGRRWKRVPSPNPDLSRFGGDYLDAVSAASADNAWAVGLTGSSGTLALRWNGHSWKQVTTPDQGLGSSLKGVSFIPPSRHAWAVGSTGTATLVLRWNGTAWR